MNRQHWIDEFFRKRLEQRTFPVEKGEFEEMRALLDKQNGTSSLLQVGRFSKWWLSALIPVAGLLWWTSGADSTNDRDPQTAAVRSGSENGYPGPNPVRVIEKGSGSVANDQSQVATLLVPTLPSSENLVHAENAMGNERSPALGDGAVPNSTNADRRSSPVRDRSRKGREEAGAADPGSKRYQVSNGPMLANDPSVAQEADRLHRTSDALAEHEPDAWKERNADDPMAVTESTSSGLQGQRTSDETFSAGSEEERVPSPPIENIDAGTTDRTIASDPSEVLAARRVDPLPGRKAQDPLLTVLKGQVIDEETKQPVEGDIEITDNAKNVPISKQRSNSSTGNFLISLPSGKNYGISVSAPGYLFHSENFDLQDTASYKEVVKVIELKKVKVGKTIVLNNVFYDFDKASFRPESSTELDALVQLLKDNGKLRIELGSHTDDKGADDYNQKLSEARAAAVVTYLTSQGVAQDRLVAKGYGESSPIAPNDTERGGN
ncbi:MAG: OmpA family protein [Flavobacteriales bacterium]